VAGAQSLMPRKVSSFNWILSITVLKVMWRDKTVTVLVPTHNDKGSIRQAIVEFFDAGMVDEIVVVNHNAALGTSDELTGSGAIEVFEPREGLGHAVQRGLDCCDSDIVVLAAADGSLSAGDLLKILAYSDEFPVVFGTRTTRDRIWAGAGMGRLLRWGNRAVAKMTGLLFNTTMLTDMGCAYRLFSREALERIRPHLTVGGSHCGPQLLMEVVAHRIPFVEIPVSYRSRAGVSSVAADLWKAFQLGVRTIALVLEYRFGLYSAARVKWDQNGRSQAHAVSGQTAANPSALR
jgi:glycosyltransferase involved in cell wall biosynthesis